MSYLERISTRYILVCFAGTSLLLLAFPAIDLAVSRMFFEGSFYLRGKWWERGLHYAVSAFLYASTLAVLGAYVFNKVAGAALWGVDGKKVLYLLLVLLLGAGLLINFVLKDNIGRARPRDIAEFGGTQQFTPAFLPAHECPRNCSFPSGDTGAAFFSLPLAMAFGRKRAGFVAGGAFGGAVAVSRMAAGAHFLSDVLVSFFLMLLLADALYYYMFARSRVRAEAMPSAPASASGASG